MKILKFAIVVASVVSISCYARDASMTDLERQTITASVDSATRAFREAEMTRDPNMILAFIAPDFYMYNDGVRVDYESTVTMIRQSMPSFQVFEPEWTNIEVIPLGPHAAVSTFLFRDSIVDGEGNVLQFRGPTTLAWERRDGEWLIVYADSDHYQP